MLLKVSCVAILIAMACLHISCASVKTETETAETKKVAETETETETVKLTEEDTTGERQKRALYYQNDLVSNQERQLRKAFPLGVNPIYDYPIYGGVLPVYDYLYYDYLVDPLYPVYPIYPIYDYYDYLYPDYLFPLSAKTPARPAATTKQLRGGARRAQAVSNVGAPKAGTRNLSGRRVQHGAQPLSRVHQHHGGHPQAAAFMNPQHLKQHQSFGEHIPHAFGQAGAPGAAPFAPPPSAAPSYLQQQQKFSPQAQAYNQQQQQQQQDRLKNQFNAIKLASSKGSARNQE